MSGSTRFRVTDGRTDWLLSQVLAQLKLRTEVENRIFVENWAVSPFLIHPPITSDQVSSKSLERLSVTFASRQIDRHTKSHSQELTSTEVENFCDFCDFFDLMNDPRCLLIPIKLLTFKLLKFWHDKISMKLAMFQTRRNEINMIRKASFS